MMITDPYTQRLFHTNHLMEYIVQAIFVVGVIVAGKLFLKLKTQRTVLRQGSDDTVDTIGGFSK
jgi:hypothetical protein